MSVKKENGQYFLSPLQEQRNLKLPLRKLTKNWVRRMLLVRSRRQNQRALASTGKMNIVKGTIMLALYFEAKQA